MTSAAFDMTDSIVPRSDQINAEDLISGPVTITITDVSQGSAEQPVDMANAEFPGRAYRPSKTMRRLIVAAWGKSTAPYVGRRITIYRDPEIMFGRDKVGGIKISHLSHIDKRMTMALTVTRGKREQFAVDPLPDAPASKPDRLGIGALFDRGGLPKDRGDDRMVVASKIIGRDVAAYGDLSTEEVDALQVQLTTWDLGGDLVDKVADILEGHTLDMAALKADATSEAGE